MVLVDEATEQELLKLLLLHLLSLGYWEHQEHNHVEGDEHDCVGDVHKQVTDAHEDFLLAAIRFQADLNKGSLDDVNGNEQAEKEGMVLENPNVRHKLLGVLDLLEKVNQGQQPS